MRRASNLARAPRMPTVSERLAVIETRLEETLTALPDKIGTAIREAIAGLAKADAVDALARRVDALEDSRNFSRGAFHVENRNRDQWQEWLRTLTPYAFMIVGALLGLKAIG